jgi:hypothetical protein
VLENESLADTANGASTPTISPSAEDVKYDEGASFSLVRDKTKIAE